LEPGFEPALKNKQRSGPGANLSLTGIEGETVLTYDEPGIKTKAIRIKLHLKSISLNQVAKVFKTRLTSIYLSRVFSTCDLKCCRGANARGFEMHLRPKPLNHATEYRY
jgi:hypothetical protein